MSADEESFIVLDETPSMLQYSFLDTSLLNDESIISKNSFYGTCCSSVSNGQHNERNNINTSEPAKTSSAIKIANTTNDLSRMTLNGHVTNSVTGSIPVLSDLNGRSNQKPTLAQSFLLGAIDTDTMKSNVKGYFPSLSSSTNSEDIEKLQSLIQERNELKDTLQKTNVTMRQQFSMVNNWHNNVKLLKDNHDDEIKKFKNINDELFHQNHDLQEKVAELQQLAEMSRNQFIQAEQNRKKCETDHLERQVIELKKQLAILSGSNTELDDVNKELGNKCNQLEVELIAIQKLFKNASEEVAELKKQNDILRKDLKQSKESYDVIQLQCEFYRTDFEQERKARENMASERDQMIADISLLKKRNQALVDEAQSYYTETSATSLTSLPTTSINEGIDTTHKFICPKCSKSYVKLNDLESHVQNCLEY